MNRCRSIAVSVMQKTWCRVPFDFDLVLTLARWWPWLLGFCWPQFLFEVSDAKGKKKKKRQSEACVLEKTAFPL